MALTCDRLPNDTSSEDADRRVRVALKSAGFGVLTELDLGETMKREIAVGGDVPLVLGACDPNMVWDAFGIETAIGALLPCNVVLRSVGDRTERSPVNPVAPMPAVDYPDTHKVAGVIRDMPVRAMDVG